jgi:hypothetical protein
MTYSSVPSGYRAVPLEANAGLFSWRVALLVRDGGPGATELVMLANLPDVRAYLGCVLDSRGMVREWVQVWVQNLEDFVAAESGFEDQISSEQLDRSWRRHWQAVREATPAALVLEPPDDQLRPLYLDIGQWRVVRPATLEGHEWVLCRDDRKLGEAGLPKYSQSTMRYLRAAEPSGASRFVAVDSRAPLTDAAPQRSTELGFEPTWLAINPQGGQMVVRLHPPLDFEDYLDLLGGAAIAEVGARKRDCEAALIRSSMGEMGQDGRRQGLMLSGNNVAELFYLKLRLLLQAGRALLTHLRQHQRPLLNLDPASFGIFPGASEELPWAWTTTCELLRPGRSAVFKIPETEEVRFVAVGDSGATAYCPAGRSRRGDLMATIQPLRVLADEQQHRVSIEGKLRLALPEAVDASDIIRFRFSQGRIAGEFCGTVIAEGAALRREIEFRTWPRVSTPQDIAQLKRFEGGKIERCWCELIPALSSPYDFYSLSILGVRALLVHENNPLPAVVDELERLGRAAGEQLPSGASLEQTVLVLEKLLAPGASPGCLAANHLFGGLPDAPKESDCLPPRLWAEALAILLRLMPGLGPVSQCSDYGSAPSGGLHKPLEEPLAALESLCARARSLVFSDWNSNREVRAVLAELRADL